MHVHCVWRAGVLAAFLLGCGPSAELQEMRRQTTEAAERHRSLVEAEGPRVAEASAEVTEASEVAQQARQRLDAVLNEGGAADAEAQARRELARAERAVEQAVAAVEAISRQIATSLEAARVDWRDLYARCVALEAKEGESSGCGPTPPEQSGPWVY